MQLTKPLKEYEVELLQEDLDRIGNELDNLASQESDRRQELLKMKDLVISDLEKINKELLSENKKLRRKSQFLDF